MSWPTHLRSILQAEGVKYVIPQNIYDPMP
jgi:hypothetical protein